MVGLIRTNFINYTCVSLAHRKQGCTPFCQDGCCAPSQSFHTVILLEPEKVRDLVLAAVALHNYLRSQRSTRQVYTPPELMDREDVVSGEVIPGEWPLDAAAHCMLPPLLLWCSCFRLI